MKNQNEETLDDIEAEIRARAKAWPEPSLAKYDEQLADRIEAAEKRERGNTERMRKALEKIVSLTNSLDENCAVDPIEIRDIARDALSSEGETK